MSVCTFLCFFFVFLGNSSDTMMYAHDVVFFILEHVIAPFFAYFLCFFKISNGRCQPHQHFERAGLLHMCPCTCSYTNNLCARDCTMLYQIRLHFYYDMKLQLFRSLSFQSLGEAPSTTSTPTHVHMCAHVLMVGPCFKVHAVVNHQAAP